MNETTSKSADILVVDDNEDNIYLVRYLLERENYNVIEALSATIAIELVKENPVDLILMDIQMPGMDGVEATKIIKNFAPQITIVALTARLMLEDKNEMALAGCDGIIEKPILDTAQFYQQIRDYLAADTT